MLMVYFTYILRFLRYVYNHKHKEQYTQFFVFLLMLSGSKYIRDVQKVLCVLNVILNSPHSTRCFKELFGIMEHFKDFTTPEAKIFLEKGREHGNLNETKGEILCGGKDEVTKFIHTEQDRLVLIS